jgi:anti-sigma factor RsiW
MSDRDDPAINNENADRWNDDLAAYALDALEPAERAALVEHLAGCPICTERLRWMAPAVDVLPATVAPQQPPEALKARLMDVVQRESSMIESAADPGRAARSERADDRRGGTRRIFGGLSLRPVLAGLGVFLLLAAGVAGYAIRDGGSGSGSNQVYAAKGPTRDSIASGSLEVDGDAGSLHVANLPATGRGEVYQAWIQDSGAAGGAIHPSSVFVVAEGGAGDVAIPHGLSDASRVMVTREPRGGSEHPSENPVLTAEMN